MGVSAFRTGRLVAWVLVAGLLGAPVALAAPSNPTSNVPPSPNFDATCVWQNGQVVAGYCAYNPTSGQWTFATAAREQAARMAIDNARAAEGLGPLILPSNWDVLTADEQQFVLVNLERIARGLPPLVGLAQGLDTLALDGAQARTDPSPAGAWTAYATGSNWAGESQVAAAMYAYMYMDGWGGSTASTPNLACTGPDASGCWGHRENILGDYGTSGLMGAADLAGSSAQLFVAYDGPPVPLVYTWSQALEAGAGGASLLGGEAGLPFADLTQALWASIPVTALARAGVIDGTAPGTFSPGLPLTLEQWVTLLGRTLDWPQVPSGASTASSADAWAAAAMAAAAARGILPDGVAATAALDRAQATSILVRAMGLPPASGSAPFSDIGGLSTADQQAITQAWSAGLVNGIGGGLFDPSGGLTRAQAATLLFRAALFGVRSGSMTTIGGQPASATQLPGDLFSYTLAADTILVGPDGSPLLLYSGPAWGPDTALVFSQGQYWSGHALWQPAPSASWPTGAVRYGAAALQLWPAGQQVGPALFQTTVQFADFGGSDVQFLPPGGTKWQTGAPALLSGAALVADMALR